MAGSDHNISYKADWPEGKWKNKTVGLLGGSFNPAHDTHLAISVAALKRLDLDAVWWLVSPQNPLKSGDDMAPFEDRLAAARKYVTNPDIHVSDLERQFGTRYTVDTLERLMILRPQTRFVWLMGADNLAQFSQWKDWEKIISKVVFAIFDRPGYSRSIETSVMAHYFRSGQVCEEQAGTLGRLNPPAWTVIRDVYSSVSSTEIRRKKL